LKVSWWIISEKYHSSFHGQEELRHLPDEHGIPYPEEYEID